MRIHKFLMYNGETLVRKLLTFRSTEDANFRRTMLDIDAKIETLDEEISESESDINKLIYELYHLSNDDIKFFESVSP